jgi:hypothetical protein
MVAAAMAVVVVRAVDAIATIPSSALTAAC